MQKKRRFGLNNQKEEVSVVLSKIQESPGLYHQYERLDERWKQRFQDYCGRKKTLPLTYDPFFKRLFHPDSHPERLSRFLSSILGKKVKVIRILPGEEYLIDGGALLIMDLLVELEDGSLANCEIQKVPYKFPGQRMSCYSADLLLRQYSRVKGERGKDFKYADIKPVYTIVIYEKSAGVFHKHPDTYIHHGAMTFDSGLNLELLQEYWLIALDVFREFPYSKDRSEQTAWLSLLATEDIADVEKVVAEFPWLAEIYREMDDYLNEPEEVLTMFSEALKILDRNTVQYMIEEQLDQITEQNEQIEEQQRQIKNNHARIMELDKQIHTQEQQLYTQEQQLYTQEQQIHTQEQQLYTQEQQIHTQEQQLYTQEQQIHSQEQQIHSQEQQIHTQEQQLSQKDIQIASQLEEIARLKKLLEEKP